MSVDGPDIADFIRRSMVARLATLSRSGRPSITPLYFVYMHGHVCLGTAVWTLAAREAQANPRVSVLLQNEQNRHDRRTMRITGRANVRTDARMMRSSALRMALKYVLAPGALRNRLSNLHLLQAEVRYKAQSAAKGPACIIEVTVERVEFLDDTLTQ